MGGMAALSLRPAKARAMIKRGPWVTGAAIVAVVFGILTIFSGGRTLAGLVDMGAVVPFVLWFNFLAGFAYVAAGLFLWTRNRWALPVSVLVLGSTLAVFAAFGVHAATGGAFEMRTLGAMTLRSAVWVAITFIAMRVPRHTGGGIRTKSL